MHHLALPLDGATRKDHHAVAGGFAVTLVDVRPHDQVGNPRLVLQGHEHDARGRSRPLTDEDQPRHRGPCAMGPLAGVLQIRGNHRPASGQVLT